jgi:septation ring formation regulator EzrA
MLSIIVGLLCFLIGFWAGMLLRRRGQDSRGTKFDKEKHKLDSELLKDEVKQLKSKIQTLEKALELSQS